MAVTAALMALICGVAAGFALRQAWRPGAPARLAWMAGGWGLIVAALGGAMALLGSAPGFFLALALLSLGVLAVVASGVKLRDPRARPPREVALQPSERASKAWRGWLRALLAGPIGGIAAMGVGLAWVVWTPGVAQTRMVIGGIMVPVLWGAAMAWTLADDRILRATGVLVGVTAVTFTASALKGFSL